MFLHQDDALQSAYDLWENGKAVLSIDSGLVQEANYRLKRFIKHRKAANDTRGWAFQLPGEKEYDTGLVRRDGSANKDNKWFFHSNIFLDQHVFNSGLRLTGEDMDFLKINRDLRIHATDLGLSVIKSLDSLYDLNVLSSYEESCKFVLPYSTTTMRQLYYPDLPTQTGARPHVDRSFITIHLGDVGGDLLALKDEHDSVGEIISPSNGEAVVFFGVKALWATGGRKEPLWHKSTTVSGSDRFATVNFCHIDVGQLITDANQALKDFFMRTAVPA